MLRNIVQAFRAARAQPGYAVAVVAMLAVVVGANTAVFSIVNSVLLEPFPYDEEGRLVVVYRHYPEFGWLTGPVSFPDYSDWKAADVGLEALAAYSEETYTYLGSEQAERWEGAEVTTDLLPLLGMAPHIGRWFEPTADGLESEPGVILSHGTWTRVFGAASDILSDTVILNGARRPIIGVMPPGFDFPSEGLDFWTALPHHDYVSVRTTGFLHAVGRLADGQDVANVTERLANRAATIDEENGRDTAKLGTHVQGLRESVVGDVRRWFGLAMGAVAFVFAVACANLMNLSLARGAGRDQEFAVRSALGAGRLELLRQLTVESLTLCVFGGALGLVLANGLVAAFVQLAPDGVPRLTAVAVNGRALVFTLLVAIAASLAIGVAPAFRGLLSGSSIGLGQSSRVTAGRQGRRTQRILVVSQLALTTLLLAGAGLLGLSLHRLGSVDPGLHTDNLLGMQVALEAERYESDAAVGAFYEEFTRRVGGLPGVVDVATTTALPFSGTAHYTEIRTAGQDSWSTEVPAVRMATVDERYFSMLGIPVIEGTGFDGSERPDEAGVAVVNAMMARRVWPAGNPVGQRFSMDLGETAAWITVIGVVPDTLHARLDEEPAPMFYRTRRQATGHRYMFLMVQGNDAALALVPSIRETVTSIDPHLPLTDIDSVANLIGTTLVRPRLRAITVGGFAIMAVLIAAMGVYAVLALSVHERRREIGVRLAIGARRGIVMRQVATQGARLIGLGLGIGTLGALALTQLLSAVLFETSARDPLALVGVNLLLAAVGLLACWLPAYRASRVDPLIALRAD